MPFNFKNGKMVSILKSKNKNNKILFNDPNDKKGYSSIQLKDDSVFDPILDPDGRSITYICGASGSGKSTFARKMIDSFHIMFPNSPIYIFSRLNEDPAFDDLEKKGIVVRVPIDQNLIDNPIDITNDIEDWSLVLFDDIDTISDKKLISQVNNIKLQILEIGRHRNIYCIITSHLINTNDRNSTRTIMNEMHSLVIFPKGGGSAYQQKYALKNYLGFNNKQINDIINTKDSRWVLISKNYPQYVLTEKSCYPI